MFTNGIIIFNQMIVMFFSCGGYFFYKKEIIDNPTAKAFALLSRYYSTTILVLFNVLTDNIHRNC